MAIKTPQSGPEQMEPSDSQKSSENSGPIATNIRKIMDEGRGAMLRILLVCAVSATGISILGCKGETPQYNREGRPLESSENYNTPTRDFTADKKYAKASGKSAERANTYRTTLAGLSKDLSAKNAKEFEASGVYQISLSRIDELRSSSGERFSMLDILLKQSIDFLWQYSRVWKMTESPDGVGKESLNRLMEVNIKPIAQLIITKKLPNPQMSELPALIQALTNEINSENKLIESNRKMKLAEKEEIDAKPNELRQEGLAVRGAGYGGYYYVNEDGEREFGNKQFERAWPFSEGVALVLETREYSYDGHRFYKRAYYYINKNGVNAFGDKQFTTATLFVGGIAIVQELGEQSYYYMNRNGVNIFGEKKFHSAGEFIGGLARVISEGRGNPYYINRNGENAFDEKNFYTAEEFSEGLAAVQEGGKWYYINKKGENAFGDKQFDKASSFKGGFANVVEGIRPYVIDKTGNQVGRNKQ